MLGPRYLSVVGPEPLSVGGPGCGSAEGPHQRGKAPGPVAGQRPAAEHHQRRRHSRREPTAHRPLPKLRMAVAEVDPVALKIVRTVAVPGAVDAIAYDPATRHIYADEDDGTRLFVVDAATFTLTKTITLPGHKPEYLAVDPRTHAVYQNISDLAEVAVIDPTTLTVSRTFPTVVLKSTHPLQYDAGLNEIAVGGANGVMAAYRPDGTLLGQVATPRFDQCDLDPTQHVLACAGDGGVTRIALQAGGAPRVIDTTPVAAGVHTDAVDPRTHDVYAVWSDRNGGGDFVQMLRP